MKTSRFFSLAMFFTALFLVSSCARNRGEIWEDSKTAGRHMKRGFCALGGKQRNSRQVCSKDEFANSDSFSYGANRDFIPLLDDSSDGIAMAEEMRLQPTETPGDPGSSIPGVEAFQDPSNNPQLASVFRHIRFPYNSNLVKGRENFMRVAHIADHMKRHPDTYIFVEGHCDERGPEAYNLALGSRRSNAVRNLLISEGVNPEQIFTISYGKERPVAYGHDEDAWALNRRAEFKVYER